MLKRFTPEHTSVARSDRNCCRKVITSRRLCLVNSHKGDKSISRRSELIFAVTGLCQGFGRWANAQEYPTSQSGGQLGPQVLDVEHLPERQQQDTFRAAPRGAIPSEPPLAAPEGQKNHVPAQPAQQESAMREMGPTATTLESSPTSPSRSISSFPISPDFPAAEGPATTPPKTAEEQQRFDEAQKKLLEEEERRRQRKSRRGRLRELEEIRSELAVKELVLLEKQAELQEKEQTVMILREELELERKLRALLTKDKEKAEEVANLALGLCGIRIRKSRKDSVILDHLLNEDPSPG